MHSSRMCTIRCSGRWGGDVCIKACTGQGCVYSSMHWAGGCLPRGLSAQEGVCLGDVCLRGGGLLAGGLLVYLGGCLPDTPFPL